MYILTASSRGVPLSNQRCKDYNNHTYYIHNVCMLLQLARIDDYALIFYKTARLDFRVKLKGNR